MSEGFPVLDIIIFALLAGFLILRLRSVLGRRTGHEKRPFKPMATATGASAREDKVIALPSRNAELKQEPAGSGDAQEQPVGEPSLADGLSQIKAVDSNFRADDFLAGARVAFEMILEAFPRGEKTALRPLLADDVYRKFTSAIDAREKAGETLETTLVGIKSAELVEAQLRGRDAVVTVKFVSEQVNVTKNREGAAIDGDPSEVTILTDVWTFQRNTRARDPNWTLVATHVPN
ncbi:MAG: Tim44 domain-containing protein [Alphaproteobacteria bacterium]|nr:Tim44 domain-containing protein [Alphaproteobacteria bacterium]